MGRPLGSKNKNGYNLTPEGLEGRRKGFASAARSKKLHDAHAGRIIKTEVTYSGIHIRLNKIRGRPNTCENCGAARYCEWALSKNAPKRNVRSGRNRGRSELLRWSIDVNDYIRLCKPCHAEYDEAPGRRGSARAARP